MIEKYKRPLVFVGTRLDMEPLIEIAELNGIKLLGILDRFYVGQKYEGLDVIGSDLDLLDKNNTEIQKLIDHADFFVATFFSGFTNTKDPNENTFWLRLERINIVKKAGCNLIDLIHPQASVSKTARIGRNSLIYSPCFIESHVDIGSFCTFMHYSGIGHHSKIGDNCAFMPGAGITGKVIMGDNVLVGLESTVLSSERGFTSVGSNIIIAPRVMVLKDVPDDTIVQINGKIVPNHDYTVDKYFGGSGIQTIFKRLSSDNIGDINENK